MLFITYEFQLNESYELVEVFANWYIGHVLSVSSTFFSPGQKRRAISMTKIKLLLMYFPNIMNTYEIIL